MSIRYVNRYDLAFCRANPDCLVVFGDNLARLGRGGQAIIRHEPNAVGIPTKRHPSMKEGSFFSDDDLPAYLNARAYDLYRLQRHLASGGMVVLPVDGLGTNRARLRRSSPAIWAQLQEDLRALATTPETEA